MGQIDKDAIPSGVVNKKIELESVLLNNVKCAEGEKDITAKVVPFDSRNDEHVDFAFAYSDMLCRAPSAFKNISEAARAYVSIFMAHTAADETFEGSDYTLVLNDLRASRRLFHQEAMQKALNDFFENA